MLFILFILFVNLMKAQVLTPEILVNMEKVSLGCRIGDTVYYTVSKWYEEDDKSKQKLMSVNLVTHVNETIEDYSYNSYSNLICKDVLYLIYNGQITSFDPATKEFQQLSNESLSIDTFKIVEVEGKLKGLASITVFPNKTIDESSEMFKTLETQRYRVYDDLMIRRWDTYWDGQFSHLFTFVEGDNGFLSFTDIMNSMAHDIPARPFGGNEEYDISSNGKYITFSILLENPASSLNNDVYYAKFDEPDNWKLVSSNNIGYDNQPIFASDSEDETQDPEFIFYLSMDEPKDESDTAMVMKYVIESDTKYNLTGNIDISFSAPLLYSNGFLHAISTIKGSVYIVGFDTKKEDLNIDDVHILTKDEGTVGQYFGYNGSLVYEFNSFTEPNDIYYDGVRMTNTNYEALSGVTFGRYETVNYTGGNGDTIYAFVHYPPNFDESKSYPAILYTHGGPESPWTNDFHYRWNPQVIAAQGYIIFAPNFHGSGSYGDAFLKSIRENWGGLPYEDLKIGVEVLPTLIPQVNKDNIAAMGASYGGYMMNWLNGHLNQFRCIICHDGIIDAEGSYYYMDELYFLETEFGYPEYENNTYYKMYNPLNSVTNYSAPQLVIHGGKDYRIDIVAGYEQFTSLQRLGLESKLVVYPEENHWVLRQFNSIDWHNQVFDWLERHMDQAK